MKVKVATFSSCASDHLIPAFSVVADVPITNPESDWADLRHEKLKTFTPCLPVFTQPFTAYTTLAIHKKRNPDRMRQEVGGTSAAVTKCSLIILHSLFFHPASPCPPLPSSPPPSHLNFPPHLSARPLLLASLPPPLYFLGRGEEEWTVTMATASWLQATCSLVYRERRAKERERERRGVSLLLSGPNFFFLLINVTKRPTPWLNWSY